MTIARTKRGFNNVLLVGMFALALIGNVLAQDTAAPAAAPTAPAAVAPVPAPAVSIPAAAAAAAASQNDMHFTSIVMHAGWFGVLVWSALFACLIGSVGLIVDSYLTIQEKKIAMRCTRIILHQEALTLDLIKTLRNVEVVHD